jgi:exonuclease VII large subunit
MTRIESLYENIKKDSKNNLSNLKIQAISNHETILMVAKNNIKNIKTEVVQKYNYILQQSKSMVTMTVKDIENLDKIISGYNPEYILQIGFLLAKKQGKLISNMKDLKVDDEIDLTFKDGTVTVKIIGDKHD